MPATLTQLLKEAVGQGATELCLTVNSPPQIRVDGLMLPLNYPQLTAEEIASLMRSGMSDDLQVALADSGRIRYGFDIWRIGRFEAHLYTQRGCPAAIYKVIPWEIKGFKELGLPGYLDLEYRGGGLHLIGGMAGSGRSATVAALVDRANRDMSGRIAVVYFVTGPWHSHKKSLVDHLVVGKDVRALEEAVDLILGTGADVVAVDGASTSQDWNAILHVAQCGVPVLATCFGRTGAAAVQEIINTFPTHHQSGIRRRLAQTLNYATAQMLLPRFGGKGRVMALELLIGTREIRNLIQANQLAQAKLYSLRDSSSGWSMNYSLAALYFRRLITLEVAFKASADQQALQELIQAGPAALEAV